MKLTMNADKRNEILSASGSLRMISFFLSEQKHQSNKEKILNKSGIIFVFKTKFKYDTESESAQK